MILFCATGAFAQSVELQVGSTVLEVGESVNAELTCSDTGEPTLGELKTPPGLELKLLNSTPNTSTSMTIVNGRGSQTTKYTYSLRLTARKEGVHRLGPFQVTGPGQSFQTAPVQITVRAPQISSSSNGDKFLFAELIVEPRSLYVTQTYRPVLTVGIRKVEVGGKVYALRNLLNTVLDGKSSELSVFSGGKYTVSEVTLPDSSGKRHGYEVYRIVQELRAEQVGEITVGPVFLKGNYPTSFRSGWFGDLEVANVRKETARTGPVTVTVKGPPTHDRPHDFNGALGRYTMSVSAKPDQVEQGQPVTLSIAFRGEPLQGIAPPNLAAHPELVSRFDFTNDEPVADAEQNAKVFRRAIFPKTQGEQTIPPITWSYFDPQREQYVRLSSEPISLTVDPPSGGTAGSTGFDVVQPQDHATKLTLLTGGISPNYVDADAALAGQAVSWGPTHLAMLGAAPLACMVITFTRRHHHRVRSDVSWARRRRARRQALQRASQALRQTDSNRQMGELTAAMTGYLSDRFNLASASLTPVEAQGVLVRHGIDEATIQEVTSFLERSDAARYAPGMIGSNTADQAAQNIQRWIDRLERNGR